jgi:FMN phosphatase YigB (HAD superfamily)
VIRAIVSDFSRVLLFPVDDSYQGGLNALNDRLLSENNMYDFWQFFKLNQELLDNYVSLRLPVYIFTSDKVQDHPAVKQKLSQSLEGVISAKQLNVKKTNSEAYMSVARQLGYRPDELLYVDDQQNNLDAARKAGLAVILHRSNKQTLSELTMQLGKL